MESYGLWSSTAPNKRSIGDLVVSVH